MLPAKFEKLIRDLIGLPAETEWVEFKRNRAQPDEIGQNISAIANAAALLRKHCGYIIWGVEDENHKIIGTDFQPKQKKVGNEELENWVLRLLDPRIDIRIYEGEVEGQRIALFEVEAARNVPVKFKGVAYVRVGSYTKKLKDFPQKERKIWNAATPDWSAQTCESASINDLHLQAIDMARVQYAAKFPKLSEEIKQWDDMTFLNKAKLTVDGAVTRAAIILLGKEESVHHLSPYVAQISWILKDAQNVEKDYTHFNPPFILTINSLFEKVRNLTYRYLPDGTLFPTEITQYDPWVIREALHNCIAHQDYSLRGRILVVEKPDELIFSNKGDFIPGSVEQVIQMDAPHFYRNAFLAQAMVNLNLIDTIGSGIKKMFLVQKKRYFPMPTYELRKDEVAVRIFGKILDKNYSQILMKHADLDIGTVMLLDKVQKNKPLLKEEHQILKQKGLVEGRYPKIFVAAKIAATIGTKAQYIRYRAFDKGHYKDMVVNFIGKFGQASRKDIDQLLTSKLSDILDGNQKKRKINNLLFEMSRKDQSIVNKGTKRNPVWILR